jgi:hypothetical protein
MSAEDLTNLKISDDASTPATGGENGMNIMGEGSAGPSTSGGQEPQGMYPQPQLDDLC